MLGHHHRRRGAAVLIATLFGVSLVAVDGRQPVVAAPSPIAQSLGGAANLLTQQLTSTVGPGGAYGQQPNAAAVPFLGATPTQGLADVFAGLAGLAGFGGLAPDTTAAVSVITDKIHGVDQALGGTNRDQLLDLDISWGACNRVGDVPS